MGLSEYIQSLSRILILSMKVTNSVE